MTLEKALEISQNIIVEKTTYLNTLEYEAQRMKETDLHAASIEAELKKTREEIAAMEIVNGRLQVYRNVAQQEGVRRWIMMNLEILMIWNFMGSYIR